MPHVGSQSHPSAPHCPLSWHGTLSQQLKHLFQKPLIALDPRMPRGVPEGISPRNLGEFQTPAREGSAGPRSPVPPLRCENGRLLQPARGDTARLAAESPRHGGGAMFERLTEQARTVVVAAHEEAADLGHGWIGSEHLVLGLARLGDDPEAVGPRTMRQDRKSTRLNSSHVKISYAVF